jgi:hypothetical protein
MPDVQQSDQPEHESLPGLWRETAIGVACASDPVKTRLNWRQRGGIPAAILMFLIGFGLLFWVACKCFIVLIFGGSVTELWSLLGVSILPLLAGWDFLPGRKRNAEPKAVETRAPTADGAAESD